MRVQVLSQIISDCGPYCHHCTLQRGCSKCGVQPRKGQLYPDAYSYSALVGLDPESERNQSIDYESAYPYSINPATKYFGPSSDFKVCISCEQIHQTCSECMNNTDLKFDFSNPKCQICSQFNKRTFASFCKGPVTLKSQNECLIAKSDDSSFCLQCKSNFYPDEGGNCIQCDSPFSDEDGCLKCSSSGCQVCREGYVLKDGKCESCQLQNENEDKYSLFTNRCKQCPTDNSKSCKYCSQGYQNSTQDQRVSFLQSSWTNSPVLAFKSVCKLRCGISQYPLDQVEIDPLVSDEYSLGFNSVLKQSGRVCQDCGEKGWSRKCTQCNGPEDDACTECFFGYYLNLTKPHDQTGRCVLKRISTTPLQFDLYVSNLITESDQPSRVRNGTLDDPYAQLTDAMEKARELAAPFRNNTLVRIHLFKGTHFVIENRGDALNIFKPTSAIDQYQLNLQTQIGVLKCSQIPLKSRDGFLDKCSESEEDEKLTLVNKVGGRFKLEALSQLRLNNIKITAIDSILPLGTKCLSENRQCCQGEIDSDGQFLVSNFDDSLNDDFNCSQAFLSLFPYDLCKIGAPQTLIQTVVNDDYVDYQDFKINTVILDKVEISDFFYPMLSMLNVSNFGANITIHNSKFERINICGSLISNAVVGDRIQNLSSFNQTLLSDSQKRLLEEISDTTAILYDNFLRISQNTYDNEYQYPLNRIQISNSSFSNLLLNSPKISSLSQVSEMSGLQHRGLIISLQDFRGDIIVANNTFSDNVFGYESCQFFDQDFKTKGIVKNIDEQQILQQNSLISVRNHSRKLALVDNQFKNNTGLKGIVVIEIEQIDNSSGAVLVESNEFEDNGGQVESNVLNIKILTSANYFAANLTQMRSNLPCGGVDVTNNTFSVNGGCHFSEGAILVQCFITDPHNLPDQLKESFRSVKSLQTQQIIASLLDPKYTTFSKITINPKVVKFDIYPQKSRNIDGNKVILRENTYSSNLIGGLGSVVRVEGVPIVESIEEVYDGNVNWFSEMFDQISAFRSQFQMSESQSTKYIDQAYLDSYPFKSQTVLAITRPISVTISGSVFRNNSIVQNHPEDQQIQAHGLLITDLAGELNLGGKTVFDGNKGIERSDLMQDYLVETEVGEEVVGMRQLEFENSKIGYFNLTGLTFQNLQVKCLNKSKAAFMEFSHSLISKQASYQQINGVSLKNNSIVDCEKGIFVDILLSRVENFSMESNIMSEKDENLSQQSLVEIIYHPDIRMKISGFLADRNQMDKGQVLRFKFLESYANFTNLTNVYLRYQYDEYLITQDYIQQLIYQDSIQQQIVDYYQMKADILQKAILDWQRRKAIFEAANPSIPYNVPQPELDIQSINAFLKEKEAQKQIRFTNYTLNIPSIFRQVQRSRTSPHIQIGFGSKFSNNLSFGKSSILHIPSIPWLYFGFNDTKFSNNFATNNNELFIENIDLLEIVDCQWDQELPDGESNYHDSDLVNDAKFLSIRDYVFSLYIRNTTFDCKMEDQYEIQTLKTGESPLFQIHPISDVSTRFKFFNPSFFNCHQGVQGTIFNISSNTSISIQGFGQLADGVSSMAGGFAYLDGPNTILNVSGDLLINNVKGEEGSVVLAQNEAKVVFEGLTIKGSSSNKGLMVMRRGSQLILDGVNITNNIDQDKAIIMIEDNSRIIAKDCKISNNSYTDSLITVFGDLEDFQIDLSTLYTTTDDIESYPGLSFIMKGVEFYDNTFVNSRLIKLFNSKGVIDSVIFNLNSAPLIQMVNSNLFITNSTLSTFSDESMLSNQQIFLDADIQLRQSMGGLILVSQSSNLQSQGNTYQNTVGQYGGCVSVVQKSNSSFLGDLFSNCSGEIGGAIYGNDFENIQISETIFRQNYASSAKGENINVEKFLGLFQIKDSVLNSTINSVYCGYGHEIEIVNNTFLGLFPQQGLNINQTKAFNPTKQSPLYGGAVHINTIKTISKFSFNTFINHFANDGGCIYVELDPNYVLLGFNQDVYEFSNLSLSNCYAQHDGGAIYIKNVLNSSIYYTKITNSWAHQGEGGGVNYVCDNQNIECELEIQYSNITNNFAQEGGGVRWKDRLPKLKQNNRIVSNYAALYGNDVASFPVRIVRFVSQIYLKEVVEGQSSQDFYNRFMHSNFSGAEPPILREWADWDTNLSISNIQSGAIIPTQYLALVDANDQVVTSNRGSKIELTLNDNQTTIIGNMIFFSSFGVFDVSGMQILTQPGQEGIIMSATAESRAIKPQNTEDGELFTLQFDLDIRTCIVGEAQIQQGRNFICRQCAENTYLLEIPPVGVEMKCKPCPDGKAVCEGGKDVGPNVGYWRKSNVTYTFLKCLDEEACIGLYTNAALKEGYSPTGNCKEGYYGALCSACMPQFSRKGDYGCEPCGNPEWNIIRMVGIISLLILCVFFLVKSTIMSSSQKQVHSVFIKILMNHMQMIFITSTFDMNWPSSIVTFLNNIAPLVEAQRALVAFDCWMDNRSPGDVNPLDFQAQSDEWRITYKKLIMYSLMPVMAGVCSISVWYLILRREGELSQRKDVLYTRFISTLVILLFLVHPQITQYMINMFNCQDFDGDLRLVQDPQIICWEQMHYYLTLSLALIGLVIWGLGIPAFTYLLMSKEKETLDTQASKIRFGFLYNGYKRENYYWEIIIMYRKIICLFIAVFLHGIGIIVQALVLLILLVVFMQLNNVMRPFGTRSLNEIEDISLTTQIITIYCGLFFISSKSQQSASTLDSNDYVMSPAQQILFLGTIIFTNTFFIVIWIIKFIFAMRTIIRQNQENLYVVLFLCCRKDKLVKEDIKLAREAKRETIIEKIEDIQFFIKKMKEIYSKEIFFEGHDRFLKMLYSIENERKNIDLSVKRYDLYVQGKIARDRKFDPKRMEEVQRQVILGVDDEFGGQALDMKQIQSSKSNKIAIMSTKTRLQSSQIPIKLSEGDIFNSKTKDENMQEVVDFSNELRDFPIDKVFSKLGTVEVFDQRSSMIELQKSFNNENRIGSQTFIGGGDIQEGSLLKVEKGVKMGLQNSLLTQQITSERKVTRKKVNDIGLDSDEEDKTNIVAKKKYRKPNEGNIKDFVVKSRNARAKINYEKKTRIFAQDLENENHAKKYMIDWFGCFKEDQVEIEGDEESSVMIDDSPQKDNTILQAPKSSRRSKASKQAELRKQMSDEQAQNDSRLLSPRKLRGKEDNEDPSNRSQSSRGIQRSARTSRSVGKKSKASRQQVDSSGLPKQVFSDNLLSPISIINQEQGIQHQDTIKQGLEEVQEIMGTVQSVRGKEEEEKDQNVRRRLRPDNDLNIMINFDASNQDLKIVETTKPPKKRKVEHIRYQWGYTKNQKQELVPVEKDISNDSELLKLSIVDSQDQVHFKDKWDTKYREVLGSYSDRERDE